jgi:uncharacterized protein (TIGR02118 family)
VTHEEEPVHKFVVLYNQPEDPEHFRNYYENTHIPLAAALPGQKAWRYSFDVSSPGQDDPPYFCICVGVFHRVLAWGAAPRGEHGRKVGADVPNYATGGATILTYPVTNAG